MKTRSWLRAFETPGRAAAILALIPTVALEAQSTRPDANTATDRSVGGFVVEVVAEDHAFSAPDEIPSGWTTLRLINEGDETHFAILTRLPEGQSVDSYTEEAAVHFVEAVRSIRSGEMDETAAKVRLASVLPAWFGSLERMGGPGLVTGGATAEMILDLEPGNYFLECYMKAENGEFHAMEGMIRPLTVTAEASGATEPRADLRMTLSNDGIAVEEELAPGQYTIAVEFAEQPEAGDPHDVHLARLDEGTDLAEVVRWMDWLDPDGLGTPAPAEFRGGTHEMPAGSLVYISVELKPGRHVWISQMTAAQGILKEFSVK